MAKQSHLPSCSFSDPADAPPDGIVAIGGPLNADRLLQAYSMGIFPWCGNPTRWHSPDPRSIFWNIAIPKNLGKIARKNRFSVSFDTAFSTVIRFCARAHRGAGEWITGAFISGYQELHDRGYAHSVEVWQGGSIAGGLYGVHIAGLFAGESMFYRVSNASKVALAALVHELEHLNVILFDCQIINAATHRLGAVTLPRRAYLRMLKIALSIQSPYSGRRWPPLGICGKNPWIVGPAKATKISGLICQRGGRRGDALQSSPLIVEPSKRFWRVERK